MSSVANVMLLPQQQTNVRTINFKENTRNNHQQGRYIPQDLSQDEIMLRRAIAEQQQKQKKKQGWSKVATALGIATSVVILAYFGRNLAKDLKADKLKQEAEKIAKEAAKKGNEDLKTKNVTSLGQFIKFEKVADDPLIADFTETKTLTSDIKKMLTDMMNDSKIDEKYIKIAGLEHKPFPNAAVLTGPTGTGKTESIRMYAKKTKANFSIVKLTDFSNSYVDGTSGNMSKMFNDIEKLLTENPDKEFVFLFDEADGIAKKLENISGDHNYLNVNRQTFLMGLEKIQRFKNCKCFAATNVNINELDKAVVNRFGRNIDFKLPTKPQMVEALKFHLKDSERVKTDNFDFFKQQAGEIDKFAQDMVNKKSSFRDLAKVTTDAQARHCRAMSDAQNDNLLFDIKYLKEALKAKGTNANELK